MEYTIDAFVREVQCRIINFVESSEEVHKGVHIRLHIILPKATNDIIKRHCHEMECITDDNFVNRFITRFLPLQTDCLEFIHAFHDDRNREFLFMSENIAQNEIHIIPHSIVKIYVNRFMSLRFLLQVVYEGLQFIAFVVITPNFVRVI